MVEAFLRVNVSLATLDQVLLAEIATLANAPALICAVPDDLRLHATFFGRADGNGIVAEEDCATSFKAGRVLKTERKAGIFTFMEPFL